MCIRGGYKDLRNYKVSKEDKGGKVAEEPKDDAMKEEPKDDAMEEEQDKNLSGDDAPIAKLQPLPATHHFSTTKFDHELTWACMLYTSDAADDEER